MLKTDHLEKDETTTPLGVGSPSNPSGHDRSHFGSSASDHAQTSIFDNKGYRSMWMCGVKSTTRTFHATRAYIRLERKIYLYIYKSMSS